MTDTSAIYTKIYDDYKDVHHREITNLFINGKDARPLEATQTRISISMPEYMTEGAGRYAEMKDSANNSDGQKQSIWVSILSRLQDAAQ